MDIYCEKCLKHVAKLEGKVRTGSRLFGVCPSCINATTNGYKNESFMNDFNEAIKKFGRMRQGY